MRIVKTLWRRIRPTKGEESASDALSLSESSDLRIVPQGANVRFCELRDEYMPDTSKCLDCPCAYEGVCQC
jgi:hypothetical protein